MSAAGPLRVAVVGAGPAGLYTAEALASRVPGCRVDVFDRLPTPFGLLRYGVAPDHLKMKSMVGSLQRTLDRPEVRFLGNVVLGRDVTVEELREDYAAVVFSYGAAADRRLGVPGEDLPGSVGATAFVAWYSGHPDAAVDTALRHVSAAGRSSVAVLGLGNVALDVARMLLRDPEELVATDVPDHVLVALRRSQVSDVHIVGRRGPENARFTLKELREVGDLAGVDVVVDPADLAGVDEAALTEVVARRNVELLREWSQRQPSGAARRLHLRFRAVPVEVVGADSVDGLRLRGPDGVEEVLAVQLVVRSIGYLAVPVDGVPFDAEDAVIPTLEHRVVGAPGCYASGWVKRGPTGVIGTNRSDAARTVDALVADLDELLERPVSPGSAMTAMAARGVVPVSGEGWSAIDSAEVALGGGRDAPRVKLCGWDELLAAGSAQAAPASTPATMDP